MNKSTRQYPRNKIKTVDYYGTKRTWNIEFEKLFTYANSLGCDSLIDCLAGSGILCLVGARTGVFKYIHLNEISYLVVNYHMTMKDDTAFNKFIELIEEYNEVIQENFNFAKECAQEYTCKRIQVRNISAKRAALFYLIQYYSYNGQGGFVDKRKEVSDYVEALKETHNLYKEIVVTQYHYKKILKGNISKTNSLIIIDAPYVKSERKQKKSYFVEFTDRQHRYLLEELTKEGVKAKIVVCGYDNKLYNGYFLRYNKRFGEVWHCVRLLRPGRRKEGVEAKERWWLNFDIKDLIEENSYLFEIIF